MKRIYRLLVILMGLMIFMGVYLWVKQDQYQMPDRPVSAADNKLESD